MLPITTPMAHARRPDASAGSAQQAAAERTASSARNGELAGHSVRRADGGGGEMRFPDHSQIHPQGVVPSRSLNDRRVAGADLAPHSKEKLTELLDDLGSMMLGRAEFHEGMNLLEEAQKEALDPKAWKADLIKELNPKLHFWPRKLDDDAGLDEVVRAMLFAAEVVNPEKFAGQGFSVKDFQDVIALKQGTPKPDDVLGLRPNPNFFGERVTPVYFGEAVKSDGKPDPHGKPAVRYETPEVTPEYLCRLPTEVLDAKMCGAEDRRKVTDAFIGAWGFMFGEGKIDPLPASMALPPKVVSWEEPLRAKDAEAANLVLTQMLFEGSKLFSDISKYLRTTVIDCVNLDSSKIKEYTAMLKTLNNDTAPLGSMPLS